MPFSTDRILRSCTGTLPPLTLTLHQANMNAYTLDLSAEEILILILALSRFISTHQEMLRHAAATSNDAELARVRVDIASTLFGKLPPIVYHDNEE